MRQFRVGEKPPNDTNPIFVDRGCINFISIVSFSFLSLWRSVLVELFEPSRQQDWRLKIEIKIKDFFRLFSVVRRRILLCWRLPCFQQVEEVHRFDK